MTEVINENQSPSDWSRETYAKLQSDLQAAARELYKPQSDVQIRVKALECAVSLAGSGQWDPTDGPFMDLAFKFEDYLRNGRS